MPIRIAYVCEQAHPREDRKRGRMVGWTWAAPMVGSTLAVTVYEWETRGGALLVARVARRVEEGAQSTERQRVERVARRRHRRRRRRLHRTPPVPDAALVARALREARNAEVRCEMAHIALL